MGRPRKNQTVTLTAPELQTLVKRLGYGKVQELLYDLAMGLIPPTAKPISPPPELPAVEGSGGSPEVVLAKSPTGLKENQRISWADAVEATESQESGPSKDRDVTPMDLVEKGTPPPQESNGEAAVKDQQIADSKKAPIADVAASSGNPKSWSDVVSGNHSYERVVNLEYIPPTEAVVKISQEEWDEGAKIWKFPVLVYSPTVKASYLEMSKWVSVNLERVKPKLSLIKNGVFLLEFQTDEERMEVLRRNWSYFHKHTLILKPWSVDGPIEKQENDSTPVWIHLPNLPTRMWTSRNLSKLASFIGKPLATDKFTGQRTMLNCAKVLVDIKAGTIFPEEITIEGPNGEIKQKVIYEWQLKKCSKCNRMGHEALECRTKLGDQQKKPAAPPIILDPPAHVVEKTAEIRKELPSSSEPPAPGQTKNNSKPSSLTPPTKEQHIIAQKTVNSPKNFNNSGGRQNKPGADPPNVLPKNIGKGKGTTKHLPNG